MRAEAQKTKDEAGRGPRSPAHPGKPQEQKQEEPQATGVGMDCWTASLPSGICLAGSETSMPTLIASTPLRDPPSRIKTVPLGPLPWMDRFCSQLWPNVTHTMNCLFQTVLAEEEKNKTSPLGLLHSQRCIHHLIFLEKGRWILILAVRTRNLSGLLVTRGNSNTLSFFPNPSGFTARPPLPS